MAKKANTKRKYISKRVRFEVFKRDSFRCQYCGAVAPDVLLEIDHIKPVVSGGDNDISNLLTACDNCNSGKGARLLSDDAVIRKQREQLEELNERREQLELMMKWREGLKKLESDQLEIAISCIKKNTGWGLSSYGKKNQQKLIKKYGLAEVLDSIDAAVSQYIEYDNDGKATDKSADKIFDMIPKICSCKRLVIDRPYMKDLFYIRGILRNRIYCDDRKALTLLELAYLEGYSIESLKDFAKNVRNWTEFVNEITESTEKLRVERWPF